MACPEYFKKHAEFLFFVPNPIGDHEFSFPQIADEIQKKFTVL